MKRVPPGLSLLQALLGHDALTDDQVAELVNQAAERESLWHDFKHGKLLEEKSARATLRQWVSGFANAEGGVLLIGFDNSRQRTPTGCITTLGGLKSVDEWLPEQLQDLVPRIGRMPSIRHHRIQGLDQYTIAVQRAEDPVPVIEGNVAKFYIRIDDDTVMLPESVAADLLLGRARRPRVHVSLRRCQMRSDAGSYAISLGFAFECETIVPAMSVTIGCISLADGTNTAPMNRAVQEIAARSGRRPEELHAQVHPRTQSQDVVDLLPFDEPYVFNFPIHARMAGGYRMNGLLYAIARGHPPQWFEWWVRPSLPQRVYQGTELTNVAGVSEAVGTNLTVSVTR